LFADFDPDPDTDRDNDAQADSRGSQPKSPLLCRGDILLLPIPGVIS
jgi:hypothetical protein